MIAKPKPSKSQPISNVESIARGLPYQEKKVRNHRINNPVKAEELSLGKAIKCHLVGSGLAAATCLLCSLL